MTSDLFKRKESYYETKAVSYAKKNGWREHKWTRPGKRGATDRFFTKFPGKILFTEFKRPDDWETSRQQALEQQRLRDEGFDVFQVHSYEEFCEIIDAR